MSLGTILVILLIILLLGGFSGRFGGYGYGFGHDGMGVSSRFQATTRLAIRLRFSTSTMRRVIAAAHSSPMVSGCTS